MHVYDNVPHFLELVWYYEYLIRLHSVASKRRAPSIYLDWKKVLL